MSNLNTKFIASEKLGSNFEQSHYTGAREFFNTIEKEFPDTKEREEAIDIMIDDVHAKYKKIKSWLDKAIKMAPKQKIVGLKEEADGFTETRFKDIIKLARKDHESKYGISKYRSTWR
tara:strand:- start:699 stop:1052 length:354 start_codon:yes stop_codon:yes gene_type:complete